MKRLLLLVLSSLVLGFLSFRIQALDRLDESWKPKDYSGPFVNLRGDFLAKISGVTEDSKGLLAGLAIGDTSKLSELAEDSMKVVSLTHLTAVSGANCAIVIGLVYLLLKRFAISRLMKTLLSVLALILYVLLVGPEPSVLRAATMASVVMFAHLLGRRGGATQALALCVIILLVSDPWLATNYGFQLSVLATLGILELAPAMAGRLSTRMPAWLALTLAVSIAAQMACLPILLQLQAGLSTYSIPANLLAEPLVAPITILGILACLFAPILPVITALLSWLASLGTWLILAIAKYFAEAPAATLAWPTGLVGVAGGVLLLILIAAWVRANRPLIRSAASISFGVILAVVIGGCSSQQLQAGAWPPSNWSVVSCDVGQGDATVIRSQGLTAVIDVGRKPGPVKRCLDRLQIKKIDLLVLTHFDLDHVGGLDGALQDRVIDKALITSFEDDRPAAAITWRKLYSASSETIEAGTGLSGSLGGFRWQVLSPHLGAAEAEDSNDASVTMLFSSPQLVFLGLADLGERGQMRLANESANWLGDGFGVVPLVVKVAHHGSRDQYPELYEHLRPQVAIFSSGAGNEYGHPTDRSLAMVRSAGASIFRTDAQGSIAIVGTPEGLQAYVSGRG
jgi:competence protein ComEC